ncbi:helix-turn-helix domain-containing protein [Leucobacter sp. HY1910]
MESMPNRITRLRVELGLDQRAAAAQSGLSQSTWNRIETGKKDPTLAELVGIAHALGVLLSTVLGHSEFRDRLQTAARAEHPNADVARAVERLDFWFELDNDLRAAGIGTHR